MSGLTKGTFDAVAQAMRAIVAEYPSGSDRPAWITDFILAVGSPVMLAEMGRQALQDATEAELFRFMIRSMDEDGPECAVMVSIMDELPPEATTDQAAFVAHLAKGMALFKAAS